LGTAAALLAYVTDAVHTFVGTSYAVPALVGAGETLPKATIWLNFMCWHIVTGVLFILATCIAAVAMGRLSANVMLPCGAAFAWISVMSIFTTLKAGIPILRFPASYLGGTTALLALLGWLK
ncbi:MAG TPA: hypothetical protein VF637_18655, partial [Sphingomicrobium sp.]